MNAHWHTPWTLILRTCWHKCKYHTNTYTAVCRHLDKEYKEAKLWSSSFWTETPFDRLYWWRSGESHGCFITVTNELCEKCWVSLAATVADALSLCVNLVCEQVCVFEIQDEGEKNTEEKGKSNRYKNEYLEKDSIRGVREWDSVSVRQIYQLPLQRLLGI